MPTKEPSEGENPEIVEANGKYMNVTLTGVERCNISDWIRKRNIKEMDSIEKLVISFDLHNNSDRRLRWSSENINVICSDGYTYKPGHDLFLSNKKLGSRWSIAGVELESGTRAKFVTVMDEVPKDTDVTRILCNLKIFKPGKVSGLVEDEEKFSFNIEGQLPLPDTL